MAACRAFKTKPEDLDFDFVKRRASGIMKASPVGYVRDARLNGSLFEKAGNAEEGYGSEGNGSVCCAFTDFWVDHGEPMAVLEEVKKSRRWPLGELPEGCEYLAIGLGGVVSVDGSKSAVL